MKKNINILLGILILVGLISAGWFFKDKFSQDKLSLDVQNSRSVLSLENSLDNNSGIRTKELYGITLKYPSKLYSQVREDTIYINDGGADEKINVTSFYKPDISFRINVKQISDSFYKSDEFSKQMGFDDSLNYCLKKDDAKDLKNGWFRVKDREADEIFNREVWYYFNKNMPTNIFDCDKKDAGFLYQESKNDKRIYNMILVELDMDDENFKIADTIIQTIEFK